MSTTTADRLALLLRTKQWQRMELEKRYPSLDFDEIPFSAYRQLWMGRAYVRGLVGAWNAYGRSNSDADREVLYDYSGHGRDIRLYNFAFEGMSGYGGYADDYENYVIEPARATGEVLGPSEAHFSEVLRANLNILDDSNTNNSRAIPSYRVRVSGTFPEGAVLKYRDRITGILLEMPTPGVYVLPEVPQGNSNVGFQFDKTGVCDVSIEMLPTYPGGLVSDGVDDYGRCVKEFSLPDDFTVVAIRRIISRNSASLVNKGQASGAFMFEGLVSDGTISNYSYGQITYSRTLPALFSYLTKTSYNGEKVTAGTAVDDDAKLLVLFTSSNKYQNAVLYDLRLYDHSLTAEELETVKDEMMADYERATGGGIDDITYVLDLDAKGRSNDEEEPMRSTWIDKKTGKVIDLHNYAYAAGSGWNGYAQNWNDYLSINSRYITRTSAKIEVIEDYTMPVSVINIVNVTDIGSYSVKVSGMKTGDNIYYYHYPSPESTRRTTLHITEDGTYVLPATYTPTGTVTDNPQVGFWGNVSEGVTIEQLPLYPGALVCDGIDDYGVTPEAVTEQVGTVLIMYNHVELMDSGEHYAIDSASYRDDPNRIMLFYNPANIWICRSDFNDVVDKQLQAGVLRADYAIRAVKHPATDAPLFIGKAFNYNAMTNFALYRLILIREQLDDAQVDFLKWKVEKEYRDWCLENGYEYAIKAVGESETENIDEQ